ncbi:hypothetical protein [Gordonia sp. NPDC003950]
MPHSTDHGRRRLTLVTALPASAVLVLAGCSADGDPNPVWTPAPPSSAVISTGHRDVAGDHPATGDSRPPGRRRTGDPRSNAEINSIGAQTGVCPAPIPGQ